MYPQQPYGSAPPNGPYPGSGAPGGYPVQPTAGQAAPYPQQQSLDQQLQQLQLQQPQQYQQAQSLTGAGLASGSPPAPAQPQAGPGAPVPIDQLQQQQPPSTPAGGASPPKSGGFMRFFGGRKQSATDASGSSPGQAAAPPNTASAGGAGGGQGTTSPERRLMFSLLNRSNAMNDQQQQQQAQQQQQSQDQQQLLQEGQSASTAAGAGLYPAVPGGQAQSQGGAALPQSGVTVVPPASGLCSKAPLPADEVAQLQMKPLGASKFGSLNQRPPPSKRSNSAPGSPSNAPAVDPNFSGPAPLEEKYGPYLRYAGYDPATRIYSASVMMVIHQSRSKYPPTLKHRDTHQGPGGTQELRNPVRLWSYAGYNFWRWDLAFQLGASPAVIEYWVVASEDHMFTSHTRHHFHLPSAGQKWHWGFYSCNGFHDHNDEVANGGIQPLWRDVMHVHARDPLHVMFGGGDQLYCDDVWKLESLLQWTVIQDKPSRNAHPFSQAMVNEVFDFYFRNYTTHFGKDVFRDALANIPQVMVWDDHDIFDGWGSYPVELQTCPVFSGVYFVARKFYLLFQCHAAENNYRELNKGWGLTGLSWTVMLGNSTAVVGIDSRGERTRRQIIRPASWAAFSDQVAKLPAGVRHVVVVASVPLVYPTVPGIEEAMMALAGTGLMVSALTAFLQKTGLSSQIYSQFGEPELLDDLLDHWSARNHEVEKYCFVRMMQDLAKARGIRFSILAGDVHCAGVAAFQSMPKISFRSDHRYMVQVISSAIGNVPPPDAVIKALTASNKPKMLDPLTREKMRGIFENNCLLKASRNWCDIHERPLLQGAAATAATLAGGVSGGPADGSLVFQLRVEHPIYREIRPYTYDVEVPILELPYGSFSPSPLPVAPPLPQPLMIKFQEELVAAGVGLEAALPMQVAAAAAGGAAAGAASGRVGASAGAGAAAAAAAAASMSAAAAAAPPGPMLMQVTTTTAQGMLTGAPPSPPPQQDYGLQSDITQHQYQQQRAVPLPPSPPPSSYPAMPPVGLQTGSQAGVFPPPSPPVGSPQAPPAPPSSFSYGGAPQVPQMVAAPSSFSYGGAAAAPPPVYGAAGAAVPPSPTAAPAMQYPQQGYPPQPPQPPHPYPHPHQQQQQQQPGYPPAPQQAPGAYPPYYPPQQHAPPAPYPPQGAQYPPPHGHAPYPHPGTAPGPGYMAPPGNPSYPGGPSPPPPYGTYPGY